MLITDPIPVQNNTPPGFFFLSIGNSFFDFVSHFNLFEFSSHDKNNKIKYKNWVDFFIHDFGN